MSFLVRTMTFDRSLVTFSILRSIFYTFLVIFLLALMRFLMRVTSEIELLVKIYTLRMTFQVLLIKTLTSVS